MKTERRARVKNYLKTHFPKTVWLFSNLLRGNIRGLYDAFQRRERRCSFGSANPDKVFYVIRWDRQVSALMGLVVQVLGNIRYAEEKGWIPVVDFQHSDNWYLYDKGGKRGDFNTWERFFEPVSPYTLNEVYQSRHVVLGSTNMRLAVPSVEDLAKFGDAYCFWNKLSRKYLRPSAEVLAILEERIFPVVSPDLLAKSGIALKLRGTDYTTPPPGHYYQPSLEQVCKELMILCREAADRIIVLATEDPQIAKAIQTRFPQVVSISFPETSEMDRIEYGQNYLAELLTLSKCAYCVGGLNGGLAGILLFGEHLKEIKTWNLGKA